MAQGKLAQVLQSPRFRPILLGLSIGLVLAGVIWKLLSDGYAVGILCLPILMGLSCFWIRKPIYTTIWIAWFVGTTLGLILWKP
jgi:hypothetical protein